MSELELYNGSFSRLIVFEAVDWMTSEGQGVERAVKKAQDSAWKPARVRSKRGGGACGGAARGRRNIRGCVPLKA